MDGRGSYVLVLEVDRPLSDVQVGKFGCFDLAAGYYLYVGSAFGAGGLPARLAHHARREKPRMHWHVDYLRREAILREAWVAPGPERLECVWCRALAAHPALTIPIPRFGARDTGCAAHLFYAPDAAVCTEVCGLLGAIVRIDPQMDQADRE